MALDIADECTALDARFPGWHVWYSSQPRGWYAVPAPAEATHTEALALPNRLGPYPTPAALADEMTPRYGWDDNCKTCGIPARECGHRQDEVRDHHPAHRMTWYVYAGRERIRHTAKMRGPWGYDVECSCGQFATNTGGATLGYIRNEVWLHKLLTKPD